MIWKIYFILALFMVGCGTNVGPSSDSGGSEYRSIDGSGNNLRNFLWGSAFSQLARLTSPAYSNGFSSLAGETRPNPREISNQLCAQIASTRNDRALSNFVMVWGQFLDHDIDLTPLDLGQRHNIPVPTGDLFFDPTGTGLAEILFYRSQYDQSTGTGLSNPREHLSYITAWIDASQVYGSDDDRAEWLRTGINGKLKTSEGDLLPFNDGTISNDPSQSAELFVAGDIRANEQSALTAMHILFVREHNRLCDEFLAEHPDWTDEQLYQYARKWVGALMQAVSFNEFLPALLGLHAPGPYTGYDPTVDPSILSEFSTAYYRMGHSMVTSDLLRLDEQGEEIPEGPLSLADAFFDPTRILLEGGIDPLLRGVAFQQMEEIDTEIVEEVRSFLFGEPGSGGMDLAAINLKRGRDHGLADYNSLRSALGLPRISNFQQLTSDPDVADAFENLYGSVNDIDPWIGALAEDHVPGASVGTSILAALVLQFERLRSGDRFWYENDPGLSTAEVEQIRQTRLSAIIRRNTGIINIPDDVFRVP